MQRPISGLSPNQTSPSQTTKILPRSNIQMSPETIINIDHNQQFPTRAESIQNQNIYSPNTQKTFHTPIQNNTLRTQIQDQHPVISSYLHHIGTPVQQVNLPIFVPSISVVIPSPIASNPSIDQTVIQKSHNENRQLINERNEVRVSGASADKQTQQPNQQRKFYKTSVAQYEKNIELLEQQLNLKSNIIRQLESESIRMRSLQDAKVILQNQLKQSEREKQSIAESLRLIQIEKARNQRVSIQNSKNDEQIRIQIFGQIQKVRRQLNESQKRESKLQEKLINYQSQMKGILIDKAAAPNIQKFKIDLQKKQKQILNLQQVITKFQSDFTKQEITKTQLNHKIQNLQNTISILEKQVGTSQQSLRIKSTEVLPIKHLQLQIQSLKKNLVSSQNQFSTQSERFNLILKNKQEQVGKLRALLETQQLKYQQISSKGNEGSKILLKEIQDLKSTLYKRQMLISDIQQTLISREKQMGSIQLQNSKLNHKIKVLQSQFSLDRNSTLEKLKQSENKNSQLIYRIKAMQTQISKKSTDFIETNSLELKICESNRAYEQSKKQVFAIKNQYDQKIFHLQNSNNELEIKTRQLATLIQQKQSEKQYFENENRTLYSNYVELRKELTDVRILEEENNLLKIKLNNYEEQIERMKTERSRRSRSSNHQPFETQKEASINFKKTQNLNRMKIQSYPRGDPQRIILSLKQENNSLKRMLQNSQEKIHEYSSAVRQLEELQSKIVMFQKRTDKFLNSGRSGNHRYTNSQEHRVMLDQVVQQMSKKLKKFKKENQELKKHIRIQKQSQKQRQIRKQNPENQNDNKGKNKSSQEQNRLKQHQSQVQKIIADFEKEREKSKQREDQRVVQLKQKMLEYKKSKSQEHVQKMALLIEENRRLTNLVQQNQSRVRQYQSLFLKFSNKQSRATEQMVEQQQKKEIQYQQQIVDNVEDLNQIEEKVNFYRVKNSELQQRVEQLLVINVELKNQLQNQTEMIKVFEGEKLYRYQIGILQQNVNNLQEKLNMVVQENNILKQHEMLRGSGMGVQQLTKVRIQQLNNQVDTLKNALSEAHQRSNMQAASQNYEHQQSSSLQMRVQQLQFIIERYEQQKIRLLTENQLMNQKLNNFQQPEGLLSKIRLLEDQVCRLESSNQRLSLTSGGRSSSPPGVLEAYYHLLNEVDKLLQRVDLVRTYSLDLVELISLRKQFQSVPELQKNLRKIADFLQDVDAIKHSISSIRRQQQKQALRGQATIYLGDI